MMCSSANLAHRCRIPIQAESREAPPRPDPPRRSSRPPDSTGRQAPGRTPQNELNPEEGSPGPDECTLHARPCIDGRGRSHIGLYSMCGRLGY